MTSSARILKAADLAQKRAEETRLQDAEAQAQEILDNALKNAKAEREEILTKARAEAEAKARDILEQAETTAKRELDGLEQEVSNLVAQTVTKVIGDIDQTEAVKAATKTALLELSVQTTAKIRAAPDVFRAVSEAVAQSERSIEGKVQQDENLTGDRVILSSDRGHKEIGLSAQRDTATQAWRVET